MELRGQGVTTLVSEVGSSGGYNTGVRNENEQRSNSKRRTTRICSRLTCNCAEIKADIDRRAEKQFAEIMTYTDQQFAECKAYEDRLAKNLMTTVEQKKICGIKAEINKQNAELTTKIDQRIAESRERRAELRAANGIIQTFERTSSSKETVETAIPETATQKSAIILPAYSPTDDVDCDACDNYDARDICKSAMHVTTMKHVLTDRKAVITLMKRKMTIMKRITSILMTLGSNRQID
ncbi:hypothetical protein HELRODRAFT_183151 [Helobdella robusta]|uniref:Uncharacterized protein n=1 Tax=Helobdella robusta TaxID=6412 RepID=T1FJ78_HELRO|nr:hypothetical protein HELRODRAFT_183151 [Helobdella robusta]ESO11458.1 hypothetical protein HELRODRAFT_183151 [Helobdella robusta]